MTLSPDEPLSGVLVQEPDPDQDGQACDKSVACEEGHTCDNGVCQGGSPTDCSAFTVGCDFGVCNPVNGFCVTETQPAGTACTDGIAPCEVGTCDAASNCVASVAPDGTACDDINSCTNGDQCTAGACAGSPVAVCTTFFEQMFETCPPVGWTLERPWDCGSTGASGPGAAAEGTGMIGLDFADSYPSDMDLGLNYAETPDISLVDAIAPVLSYQHWRDFDSFGPDGYQVQISTDGGTTWLVLDTVTPDYDEITFLGEPVYSDGGPDWERVLADLTAFVGETIRLRFAATSDSFSEQDGAFLDEVMILEAPIVPVVIDPITAGPAVVGIAFEATVTKAGGTSGGWSIQPGGTNDGWLSIDPVSGLLSGTPTPANVGSVTVNVRYTEPSAPTNFDDLAITFDVVSGIYVDDFETSCASWTFTGDWACGPPTSGPAAAVSGSNVIATNLSGNYATDVNFGDATATSSPINLTGTTSPQLSFAVWHEWEAFGLDGFNLQVSTDGGSTFSLVSTVTPTYDQNVQGEATWGDPFATPMWDEYVADLSAFAGQTIILRFQYASDSSFELRGTYVDDILVFD